MLSDDDDDDDDDLLFGIQQDDYRRLIAYTAFTSTEFVL